MSIFFNILLGIILGLDAFTLAISLGSFQKSIYECRKLIVLIAIFHFMFPICGSLLGSLIHIPSDELKIIVYFYLMIEMSLDYFNHKPFIVLDTFINYLILAFFVSIDSFSIGISLYFNINIVVSCLLFSIIATSFTIIGLKIGNGLNKGIGEYANIVGILLIIIVLICQIISS